MNLSKNAKRILAVLDEHGELSGPQIEDRLSIASGSVSDAMDRYLLDEELVRISRVEDNPGSAKATRFYTVTDAGAHWLDEHRDEVTIDGLDELMDSVKEAVEMAESANETSRTVQKNHSRLKGRVEDVEQEAKTHITARQNQRIVDVLRSEMDDTKQHADDLNQTNRGDMEEMDEKMRDGFRRLLQRVESLETRVVEQQERIEELEAEVEENGKRRFF